MSNNAPLVGTVVFLAAAIVYGCLALRVQNRAEARRLTGYDRRRHSQNTLTDRQKRLLTFSLFPAYLAGERLLSLDSDPVERDRIAADFAKAGLTDRDAIVAHLDYLLSGARSTALDDALRTDEARFTAAKESLASTLHLRSESLDCLCSTFAWDLGEAALLAKDAYLSKVLSAEELWHYLEQVSDIAQRLGQTWQEYTLSYLLGRLLDKQDLDAIQEAAFNLYYLPLQAVQLTPGLNAYTLYPYTINKNSTGMNKTSCCHHCGSI